MDKLDRMISEALDDEDREILDKIGREQSVSEMALDLIKGKAGWLNWTLIFCQTIWFAVGIYAAWKAYVLTDLLDVVRWGLVAVFFMLSTVIAKVGMLPSFQANRMLRAMKHLEMQVALLAAKR